MTTEFSGPTLGLIEITHWYEVVFLLGFVYLFFAFNPVIGVVAVILVYLLELLIDNASARVKWQLVMKSSWIIAAIMGIVNLAALYYLGVV